MILQYKLNIYKAEFGETVDNEEIFKNANKIVSEYLKYLDSINLSNYKDFLEVK